MSNLSKVLIKSTIWTSIGQIVTLLIALITNIWLARLLTPIEFGQIGVVMFFINLFTILTEGGLGGALVRKKNIKEEDYSTVFITNLVISISLYLLLFFASSNIALFYNDQKLEILLKISGVILLINAFQIVQNTKLVVEMKFNKRVFYTFISVFISSLIGLILAYMDYGIWSLLYMQILVSAINTILLWVFESSNFSVYFSKSSFKELFGFGVNTTVASVLNVGFDNIYQLIFAKYFSFAQNGYFYQAKRLQDVPGNLFTNVSQTVFYSVLAKYQGKRKIFDVVFLNIYRYYCVLLGLVCAISFIYSEEIVSILYGSKWINIGYFIKLLSMSLFFFSLENLNRQIFKIFDYSGKVLIIEFFKKTVLFLSICLGVYYKSIDILLYGMIFSNLLGYIYSNLLLRRVINIQTRYSNLLFYKQLLLLVLLVSLFIFINNEIQVFNTLFTIPLFVVFYLIGLKYIGIINIFKILKERGNYGFKRFI